MNSQQNPKPKRNNNNRRRNRGQGSFSNVLDQQLRTLRNLHNKLANKLKQEPTYEQVNQALRNKEITLPAIPRQFMSNMQEVEGQFTWEICRKMAERHGVHLIDLPPAERIKVYQKFLIDDPGLFSTVAGALLGNETVRNAAWNAGADAVDYIKNGWNSWWNGSPVADSTGNTQAVAIWKPPTTNTYSPPVLYPPQSQSITQYQQPSASNVTFSPTSSLLTAQPQPQRSLVYPEEHYSMHAVNPKYVASFISPENYTERRPSSQPMRTAIATGSYTYTINVNVGGAAGVFIFPKNILGDGASKSTSFLTQYSDTTFNPFTGVQTTNPTGTLNPGPLYGSTGAIEQYLLSTMSVEFIPQMSVLNQQGTMQLVYYQRPINGTLIGTAGVPTIPQSVMGQQPYFTMMAYEKTSIPRAIRLPVDTDQFMLNDSPPPTDPWSEGWYFLFRGLPASGIIGQMIVTFSYEFVPQQDYAVICSQQLPAPGIATQMAIANIQTQYPSLWHLDQKKAASVAESIVASDPKTHDALICKIRELLDGQLHTSTKKHYMIVDDKANNVIEGVESVNSSVIVD